jgi:predicted transcriptional regulator
MTMTIDLTSIIGIVSLLAVFTTIIASHTRNSTRLDVVQKDLDDHLKWAEEAKKDHHLHVQNTAVHVDPVRDELRWRDLLARLDRIEGKLDHGQG